MNKFFIIVIACVALAVTSCSSPAEDIVNDTEVTNYSQANIDIQGTWSSDMVTPAHIYTTTMEFKASHINGGIVTITQYIDNEVNTTSSHHYTITDKTIILDGVEYAVDFNGTSFTFNWIDDEPETFHKK